MALRSIASLAVLAALLLAPAAAADPAGTCVGGYNPDALSNVCYQSGPGSTVRTGSVGTGSTPVCIIGDLCQNVPVPTYDPNGGVGVPVPGAITPTHVEVAGRVLYPADSPVTPCEDGNGVQVGNACVQACEGGIQVGNTCFTSEVGPCYEDGTGVAVGGRCLVQMCTDAAGNSGVQVGTRCISLGAQ